MIIETPQWKLAIEVHPEGWRFPAGVTWLAGWLWSPQERVVTDLRAWVDGRCFLANWGLPKPGLDEVYLKRPGPPYLGFTLAVEPHAGASLLRIEVRDQTNHWHPIFSTPITVDGTAMNYPAQPGLPEILPLLTNPLLRLQQQRPGVAPAALADELVSGALSEPRNALPGPPFFGALEAPREIGWVRFGRLSITGWIAHQHQRIRRITAMVDPLQEGSLLYGQRRTDLHTEAAFAGLVGVENSAFVGHVDLPADTCVPALLKLFAELDNGEKHLVFAQRFTPRVIAGAVTPLPARSLVDFLRAAWTLRASVKRHGRPPGTWATLRPALAAAWATYKTEAPPRVSRARLAAPPPGNLATDRPLRVLVFTHNLNFEGAPWFIFELACFLAKQPNASVRIVSPQSGPMQDVFTRAGLPVTIVDAAPAMRAKSAAEFDAALRQAASRLPWDEIDLVIANTMVSFWAIHAARAAGKPSLLYVHESSPVRRFFELDYSPALFPIIEDAFRSATRVVFTADSSRQVYASLGDRGNFTLLPSWVDAERIDAFAARHAAADLRRKHALESDAVLVVNIGSVCERKGQHIYIQAVDLLRTELARLYPGKKIRFVMVGARPGLFLETLKEEISRLGVGDLMRFAPETGEIFVGSSRVDLQACKLEYSIVSPK